MKNRYATQCWVCGTTIQPGDAKLEWRAGKWRAKCPRKCLGENRDLGPPRYVGTCGKGHTTVRELGHYAARHVCNTCGDDIDVRRITGIFSADYACNSACREARGSECVCACGGANHGGDWAQDPAAA